jgi:S1-C subfamily serine protease
MKCGEIDLKKYKIISVISLFLNVVIIAGILLYAFVFRVDATKIYNNSIQSIVEVKATTESVGESYGTGEIIKTDGTIVTNAHVVTYTRLGTTNEFDNCYIRFASEEGYREVYLVKYDTDLDLAVLKLDDIKVKTLKTADSSKLNYGDKVYAIGNTSNKGIGISEGIISVPLVNIIYEDKTRAVIQCDLTIAQGNSGGALLDKKGKLIGITTFRTKDNSGNVIYGIVYCIPINIVLDYIN